MDKPNESWERLLQVMAETGYNPNSFAKHIGLPRGENLYQIKRGNNRISKNVAELIHAKYPQYSVGWLVCGKEGAPPTLEEQGLVRVPLFRDQMAKFPPEGVSGSLRMGGQRCRACNALCG